MTLLIPTFSLWYAITFAFMCLGIIGFVSLSVALFVLLRPEDARAVRDWVRGLWDLIKRKVRR